MGVLKEMRRKEAGRSAQARGWWGSGGGGQGEAAQLGEDGGSGERGPSPCLLQDAAQPCLSQDPLGHLPRAAGAFPSAPLAGRDLCSHIYRGALPGSELLEGPASPLSVRREAWWVQLLR